MSAQAQSPLEYEEQPLLDAHNIHGSVHENNDDFPAGASDDISGERQRKAEQALVRKVDRRMSILVLIYILNYMDRNNAGAARLRGFEEDLHLEGSQFATLLSVLYISYILMQIPSNMFLNYYKKPSKYLPWCMTVWGVLSICMGSATSFYGVLFIRFLLGFAEAAFFPGALFLITKWYKRNELSERTALLSCGILLSNAFGSLIASGILDAMNGLFGFAGWRWLFFVEGILTVVVAVWSMFILPDFPENTTGWLSPEEKALAVRRMAEDGVQLDQTSNKDAGQWVGLSLAVHDWKVWWLALALLSLVTALSFGVYFPTLAATMGNSVTISLLLCVPPWLVAAVISLAVARHSDKHGERFKHITISLLVGIAGFALAMSTMNSFLRYLSMFLMAQMYAAFICFLAWASGSVSHPPAKRAVALALINCVSQAGNVAGSYIWPWSWGPSYNQSFYICVVLTAICILMCAVFRHRLLALNKQAEARESEAGESRGFRYML